MNSELGFTDMDLLGSIPVSENINGWVIFVSDWGSIP